MADAIIMYKATFTLRFGNGRAFSQTVRELADPTDKAAVKHGRRILAGMFPSARIRLVRVVRDHAAEKEAARRMA